MDSFLSFASLDCIVAALHVYYSGRVDVVVTFGFAFFAVMGVVETMCEAVLKWSYIHWWLEWSVICWGLCW
jgi:hypothetical protein